MGLSRKPTPVPYLKDWKDLDSILLPTFSNPSKLAKRYLKIDTTEYSMSLDEIKIEAEKKGYQVKVLDDNHLEFT